MRETVGTLVAVWQEAYNAKSEVMAPQDIDTAAELDGFAEHLSCPQVALADALEHGMRLHGVRDRIDYLLLQAERGRKGGHISQAHARAYAEQTLERVPSVGQALVKRSPSLPLAPDPPPAPTPDLPLHQPPDQIVGGDLLAQGPIAPRVKRKPGHATQDEREKALRILSKLSERNGIKYQGGAVHVQLIASQLRSGVTEGEMRAIVAMQAEKWGKSPQMLEYLRPETLFGPRTIAKYLDEAKTKYAEQIDQVDRPTQPMLQVVR
jgi:uncharacterized phage protein (TIGR02220 family)